MTVSLLTVFQPSKTKKIRLFKMTEEHETVKNHFFKETRRLTLDR